MALGLLIASFQGALAEAAMPPSEQVLPAATKAYLSVPDMPKLLAAWQRTPIGRLLDDPAMQPFHADLKRQLHAKDLLIEDRVGITFGDLEKLPTGETAVALVQMPDGRAAGVALIDVTNNLQAAGQMLQKVDGVLQRNGAKRSMHASRYANAPVTVYDIPPKGKRKQAVQAVYVIENGVLGISDNLGLLDQVLSRLRTPKPDSLASVAAYRNVNERCAKQAAEFEPHLRWWVDPAAAGEAMQNSLSRKPTRDLVAIAKKEGFTAIRAIGGYVTLAAGPYGVVHRSKVFAPPPYARAMRMLTFPNASVHAPESWVPSDVASYMTFRWEMNNAFDNFGTLFDEIVGEGEQGVWNDVIDSMKTDPNGPQIDVKHDLIAHLGTRCSIQTDNVDPIGPHSQRRLFAAETTNEQAVAAAVDKLMQNDPSVKLRTFKSGDTEYKIYEIIPEDQQVPAVQVQVGNEPAAAGQAHPHMPHSAVTVGLGYLFVASHVDLLEQILSHPSAEKPLDPDGDYQRVIAQFPKLNGGPHSAEGFTRDDERFRVSYELIRQGKLPEADLPLAEAVNAIFQSETPEGEVRKPKIDGSKLPDFAVVRKYLSFGGSFVQSEADGWMVVGFTMNDKNANQAAQARADRGNVAE
ncbi:MAG TPA: hypothetical protein VHZ24_07765 [Pirellulales bacterium]|nr:hypothetical protein [Pirellulales bacterium]